MDKRILKTRDSLKKSLILLMKDKPLKKISIKELCESAHVNRSTFYMHYKSTEQLLELLMDDMLNEFTEAAQKEKGYLRAMLEVAAKNRQLLVSMMDIGLFKDYIGRILSLPHDRFFESRGLTPGDTDAEYKYIFISHGIGGMVSYWFNTGMTESIAEIEKNAIAIIALLNN